MGKSFGVNSKAQEGRERKAAQKEMKHREVEKKKEVQEAKDWLVGAKTKSTKQISDEQKRQEKAQKKMERDQLEAAELAELSKHKPLKPLPKDKTKKEDTAPLRLRPEGIPMRDDDDDASSTKSSLPSKAFDDLPEYSASNIDDALFLLDATSSSTPTKVGSMERHPERRVKAAYAAFEERELPMLKENFPGLRLSQLKEKLHRMWQKSPENPFNQSYIAYNTSKTQEVLKAADELESNLKRLRLPPS